MLIRRERPGDAAAIDAVHRSAFASQYANAPGSGLATTRTDPPEVGLVRHLRDHSAWIPTLSMVAEIHQGVVGHVCLTRAGIGPFPVLALGPIGVLSEAQAHGAGSALMHAALGAAEALDETLVGLLGSLDWYPRFGFVPGARLGIAPDQPDWAAHFQVRPLAAYDGEIIGDFRYPDPFYEL
ncbi:GNAT family N-acetyltransferase [Nocardia sp. NPDC003693]